MKKSQHKKIACKQSVLFHVTLRYHYVIRNLEVIHVSCYVYMRCVMLPPPPRAHAIKTLEAGLILENVSALCCRRPL